MDYHKKLKQQQVYRATDWICGLPLIVILSINYQDYIRTGFLSGEYVVNIDAMMPHLITGAAWSAAAAVAGYCIGFFVFND